MGAGGETQEGLEGRHRCAAPVEAEGELFEVGLEVIVHDAVVGAAEPGIEVAKDPVDLRQELRLPFGRALRAGAMAVAHVHERSIRSEEHTSDLQSLLRISYAVFCW